MHDFVQKQDYGMTPRRNYSQKRGTLDALKHGSEPFEEGSLELSVLFVWMLTDEVLRKHSPIITHNRTGNNKRVLGCS